MRVDKKIFSKKFKKIIIIFCQQRANKNRSTKAREEESLDEDEFVGFYYSLLKRPELDEVFIRYFIQVKFNRCRISLIS